VLEIRVVVNPETPDDGDVARLQSATVFRWKREGMSFIGTTWRADAGTRAAEPWDVDVIEDAIRKAFPGRQWMGTVAFGGRPAWGIGNEEPRHTKRRA
jgi:hypothetical protein